MAAKIQVLFDRPQKEIASLLRDRLSKCQAASMVAGFMTVEGIESIAAPIKTDPTKLQCLVVGAGTYRAYEVFDDLLAAHVPPDRLYVHLGFSRATGPSAKYRFLRYHPMLHSKVYLFDMEDGTSCAFVGSHNLTGFALLGLNGEAAILVEAPATAPEIADLRQHIEISRKQAAQYASDMKDAYWWWTIQFLDGLKRKANDRPTDDEARRTIVIIAVNASPDLPQEDDLIFFEIADALRLQSLTSEVHLYVFGSRPATPTDALKRLHEARASFWCITRGLEDQQGGVELKADWFIANATDPALRRTSATHRPRTPPGMQQVRVQVRKHVFDKFEYYFETAKATWEPVYDEQEELVVSANDRSFMRSMDLIPREDQEWSLVRTLRRSEPGVDLREIQSDKRIEYKRALLEMSPEAGGFVLMSLRRRKLELQ